jgi:hypothetical protein
MSAESVGYWGALVADELYGVREVNISAIILLPNLNLSNEGETAVIVRVSYESGFEEADEVMFVGGLSERGGKKFSREDSGA